MSKILIDGNYCAKPITQYDLNGNKIREWKSAAEVERNLGYHAENISSCCLKKAKTSHYFIWRFTNDIITNDDIKKANKALRLSEVRQYDLNGQLLNTFKNTLDAARKTDINRALINSACNGTQKTAHGFIWAFKNQPVVLETHVRNKDKTIYQFSLKGELIKIWSNINQIIIENNYSKEAYSIIYRVCRKKIKHYKYFIWSWDTNVTPIITKIKPILQLTLDGQLIKSWNTLIDIKKSLKYPPVDIRKCCRGIISSYGGYVWKWDN